LGWLYEYEAIREVYACHLPSLYCSDSSSEALLSYQMALNKSVGFFNDIPGESWK
jgi:hypothetical protein